MPKIKNHTLDILKVVCSILIVFNHCVFPGTTGEIIKAFSRIAVPIFFLISGYYVFNNSKEKVLKKCKRIFKILVFACIFWFAYNVIRYSVTDIVTLKYYLLNFVNIKVITNFILFNANPFWGHLWFLNALCYCYLIYYFIIKKNIKIDKYDSIISIFLIVFYLVFNYFFVDDNFNNIDYIRNFLFVGLPFFLIGRYLRRKEIANKIRIKYVLPIILISSITLIIECLTYSSELYISTIIISISLLLICMKKPNYSNKVLEYIGANLVLYVYIIHPGVKYIILWCMEKTKLTSNVYYYIYPIIVAIISIILSYIIYKINLKVNNVISCQKNKKLDKKQKCLVVGYANGNFGDDLFFHILFTRYPNVIFYFYPPSLLLNKYKRIFRRNKNVIFYDNENYYLKVKEKINNNSVPINIFPMICERAKKVDSYINIGGSIFIQDDNWKNDDRFKLKELIGNKPSFIIGCNFGPSDKEYYEYYKNWFKKFDDICFRDDNSYNMFKDLNNTHKADDIVLLDKYKKKFHIKRDKKSLGISVLRMSKENKNYHKYINFIKDITNYFTKNGFKVNYFSFCENEGDLDTIKEIVEIIEMKDKVKIINYGDDITSFLRKWYKNEYVICTRFHASILALKYNQKFIPIAYSDKTKNFLKNISKNIEVYDINELDKLDIEKMKFIKIEKKYNSEEHFKKIDKYYEER